MRSRGFTLIELLVAGTVSVIVVLGAFLAITGIQRAAARHERATELLSQARVAMELIGRDLRAAGDSVDRFPAHCIDGFQHAGTTFRCGAILEPHPWRVVVARNSWTRGTDGVAYTMDDQPPTGAFDADPENAIAYQFVPRSASLVDLDANGRKGVVGRLERVVNPFRFGGRAPELTVLLDGVVLDNRMRVSPQDPTDHDPRFDYSMFLYQLVSASAGEYAGDPGVTNRTTRLTHFVLPPMRFFDPFGPYTPFSAGAAAPVPPYLPAAYVESVLGLSAPGTAAVTSGPLRTGGASFADDLRYVIDENRIRAVHVGFHVVRPVEDPDLTDGVDLDPDHPGTAQSFPFEATFELKVLATTLG